MVEQGRRSLRIDKCLPILVKALSPGARTTTIAAVNDVDLRRRLSPTAVKGFLHLAKTWGLTRDEQVDLLGGSVTRQTLGNWAGSWPGGALDADQLMRISFLLAIYEGLERIWRNAPHVADAWIRRARPEVPFRGQSPIAYMRAGGIPALALTRAYIDNATGGPPSRADCPAPPRE